MKEQSDDAAPTVHDLLTAQGVSTARQIAALTRNVDIIIESAAGVATDDEHDPEGATIAFERAQAAALLKQAHQHLEDVDAALARLRNGTYGVCDRCGGPIAAARLGARPAARSCIDCATSARR